MQQYHTTTEQKTEKNAQENQKFQNAEGDRLAELLQKKGSYDEKLFCYKDKATYTYISAGEVMSLHFDKQKGALFFKGRHIESWKDVPHLEKHFAKFKRALLEAPESDAFIPFFEAAILKLA